MKFPRQKKSQQLAVSDGTRTNSKYVLSSGSGEEQAAAATVFSLLCIQLGGGDEAEEGFKMLRPILTAILMDNSASIAARQSVSNAINHLAYCAKLNTKCICFYVGTCACINAGWKLTT